MALGLDLRATLTQDADLLLCDCVRIAEMDPLIPYDAYHRCRFARDRTLAIAFTGISLLYGMLESKRMVFADDMDENQILLHSY